MSTNQHTGSSTPGRWRSLRRALVSLLAAVALVPVTVLAGASPAAANTSDFRGFNWARMGDNFTSGRLVLDGMSINDGYDTVYAKADAVYSDMESLVGANTVRLPINTHTVADAWWNNYRGAIDAATDRGFKVILAYWEDGAASGGRVDDVDAFNSMWSSVTNTYGSNGQVYFEPMNEPHGYSSAEWRDFAAGWLDYHYSAPADRVLIGGTGYSQDLRPICDDSRFDGTLLSMHYYAFMYSERDYWGHRNDFEARLGNCGNRAVTTEYGAPMDNGLNYNSTAGTDNFVNSIRAVTDEMREQNIGGTYWPALGGKPTDDQGYDWYSMFALHGSGTDLSLSIRNQSGADRIRYGWGDDTGGGGGGSTVEIQNRYSGLCLDDYEWGTEDGAEVRQWTCNGSEVQQWELEDLGNGYHAIRNAYSGLCLDDYE
ncbi:cellulase family glycosylhydrolase, partial [Glycomyces xiaoerkulensis]|uniref:cellulase family glycosylhydrolase n=1 Tax=Glycomyces xiaoerkulensis TaxID=2038139 RepID=UPI000C2619E8